MRNVAVCLTWYSEGLCLILPLFCWLWDIDPSKFLSARLCYFHIAWGNAELISVENAILPEVFKRGYKVWPFKYDNKFKVCYRNVQAVVQGFEYVSADRMQRCPKRKRPKVRGGGKEARHIYPTSTFFKTSQTRQQNAFLWLLWTRKFSQNIAHRHALP